MGEELVGGLQLGVCGDGERSYGSPDTGWAVMAT